MMKINYFKQKPSAITCRKFKIFSNNAFVKDLDKDLAKFEHLDNIHFNICKETMNITLDKHAPTKKNYVRANQTPVITKTFSKKIMKRSRVRKKFLNTKSNIDRKEYKQMKYVVTLLRKKRISMVIVTSVE